MSLFFFCVTFLCVQLSMASGVLHAEHRVPADSITMVGNTFAFSKVIEKVGAHRALLLCSSMVISQGDDDDDDSSSELSSTEDEFFKRNGFRVCDKRELVQVNQVSPLPAALYWATDADEVDSLARVQLADFDDDDDLSWSFDPSDSPTLDNDATSDTSSSGSAIDPKSDTFHVDTGDDVTFYNVVCCAGAPLKGEYNNEAP